MTIRMAPLPAGWKQSRLRFVAAINPSKTEISHLDPSTEVSFVPMEAVGEDASLDASRLKPISEVSSGYTYFRDGDILIAKITPCFENGKATLARGLTGGFGFGSTEFHVVRPSPRLDARFAFYVIRSNAFRDYGAASMYGAGGQKRVPTDFLADFPVALPPLPEQRAVADFLDRETAKIDALIAKQEELIERVEEKRRALVTHSVVQGLDASAPMRKNGARWLGASPSHWRLLPLRRVVSKFVDYRGSTPEKLDTGVPLITATAIRFGRIDHSRNPAFISPEEYEERMVRGLPAIGDVVMTTEAPLGEVAQIDTLGQGIGQRVILFKMNNDYMLPRMLFYFLLSSAGQGELWSTASGSTAQGIKAERLKGISVIVPPIFEQEAIVTMLDRALSAFEPVEQKADREIALLRERRSAFITAAVTGQIEVLTEPVMAANDNRQALRAVVGAEIVSRQGSAKNFGRVKLQKLIYLAEVHAGIHELAGNYVRQAAGPLAPDLLSETERGMEAGGFYRTVPPTTEGDGYIYSRIGKAGAHGDQFAAMLGDRAATLTQLIDRFKDYDTRQVEAITTLYAVWNDALIDGETPTDDRIIRGVLEEWHPEKKDKFTATDLKTWLAWMRRNGVVPTGTGSRTQLDRLFV